jgi:hypothetical protein
MSTEQRDRLALPGEAPTDEDLRHEVELTRQELGDTVAALMYKVDVKARMREAAQRKLALLHDATSTAAEQAHDLVMTARRHPVVIGGGALVMAALLVLLGIRR